MCGWQHVGYGVKGKGVCWTDWGQLSIELLLAKHNTPPGERINLRTLKTIKGRSLHDHIKSAIDADVKGVCSLKHFTALEADANWLLVGDYLWSPRLRRFLTAM